jgi:CDP-4-dehydro-6-deoxyglucose reductase
MIPEWQQGVVTRIEDATHNTRRFFIELSQPMDFKPGQFVTIDLPIHEQRNKRWRSYSIASRPGMAELELIIVLAEPSTGGSKYFFDEVRPGTSLTLRGPNGIFTIPPQLEVPLVLVCTGTGIAPFRSMVQHIHAHGLLHRDIHLVFGCRTQADLLYADEMEALTRDLPGFYYYPTLSREHWDGYTGYVHAVYEQILAGPIPAYIMLCGWKVMVDEAKQRLLALGYDKKSIHLELYG